MVLAAASSLFLLQLLPILSIIYASSYNAVVPSVCCANAVVQASRGDADDAAYCTSIVPCASLHGIRYGRYSGHPAGHSSFFHDLLGKTE